MMSLAIAEALLAFFLLCCVFGFVIFWVSVVSKALEEERKKSTNEYDTLFIRRESDD